MILSVSRRTDIPSYYSEWFYNRIKDGFVYVRNPMNIHQIGQIDLSPQVIDGIVFWTKNPLPMIERLNELKDYPFYFQFTLNSYDKDIEPNIPSKNKVMIPAFQNLSNLIGKEKIIWRYDPIFLNKRYTLDYHIKYFERLANRLGKYTEKCTISFLDTYKNIQKNIKAYDITVPSNQQKEYLMNEFSKIALSVGIVIDTCAENIDLSKFGIKHACCVDKQRFERIGNYNLIIEKDRGQRSECGCVSSIDIGAYNTCKNGCIYCYANHNQNTVLNNFKQHDPNSPLLYGNVDTNDIIKVRDIKSCRNSQLSLWD